MILSTTTVDAHKTIGELYAVLVKSGARAIQTEYSPAGRVSAVSFMMLINGREYGFRLPSKTQSVLRILQRERKFARDRAAAEAQAERITWRQLLMWTKAQLVMIEIGLARAEEVYLPYMTAGEGQTFFEAWENKQKALPAPTQTEGTP